MTETTVDLAAMRAALGVLFGSNPDPFVPEDFAVGWAPSVHAAMATILNGAAALLDRVEQAERDLAARKAYMASRGIYMLEFPEPK